LVSAYMSEAESDRRLGIALVIAAAVAWSTAACGNTRGQI